MQEKKAAEEKSSSHSSYKERGYMHRPSTDLYEGANFKIIRQNRPYEFYEYFPKSSKVKKDFNYEELKPFWRHKETNNIYREKDGALIGKITKDGFCAYAPKHIWFFEKSTNRGIRWTRRLQFEKISWADDKSSYKDWRGWSALECEKKEGDVFIFIVLQKIKNQKN